MNQRKSILLRLTACLICIGFLLPLGIRVSAAAEEQVLTPLVRSAPRRNAAVIGQLAQGTAVEVLRRQGDYFEVDLYGMTGFISVAQLGSRNGRYFVRCHENSGETGKLSAQPLEQGLALRHALLQLAQEQLGTPYVYGGRRPGGFDCSGLTYYLYEQQGIALHRTASQQLQDGIAVAKENLQLGDLIFFREPYETTAASHVGIYVGDGQIIHAGSRGISYANLEESYFRDYYLCARRLVILGEICEGVETPVARIPTEPEALYWGLPRKAGLLIQ